MVGRRRNWSTLILLALALGAAPADAAVFQMRLRADPDRVPADGETAVVVSVEIVNAAGSPAPDGTLVHFTSTLGEILSPAETIGGFAQTVLKPSNVAGTALVSAMAGASRATIEVEFTAAPGSVSPGSRMVEIAAEELSYCAGRRVFVATWGAELHHQSISIHADGIQYEMQPNVVRAQGNVILRSNSRVIEGDALRFELRNLRGRLLRVSENVETLLVEGDALETRPDPSEDPCLWEPLNTDDTQTWVKARSAIVDPGQKVILDHATFYVGEEPVLSLRRHVLNPMFGEAVFGHPVSYSTHGGVNMDFPFYYHASGSRIGALHFTRNQPVGGVSGDRGWALGLREEYFRSGKSEGSLSLTDITDPDRGIRLEHQMRLRGGARLSFDAGTTDFDDGSPQLYTAGVNFFRPLGGGRLSLALSGSQFGDSVHYFGDLSYGLRTISVGHGVLLRPVVRLRHSHSETDLNEVIVDPLTGEPFEITAHSTGSTTSPGIDLSFDLPSRDIGGNTRLTAGLTAGYAWGVDGGSRSVMDGRLSLMRRFGRSDYVRLSYSYASAPAGLQPSVFSFGQQRLRLDGGGRVGAWHLRLNASRELDGSRMFGSLSASRPLPFGSDAVGRPLWTLDMSHVFTHLEDHQYGSSRFALRRQFGRFLASLCYSPQGYGLQESRPWVSGYGYGYTYASGRKVWLELSASGFGF